MRKEYYYMSGGIFLFMIIINFIILLKTRWFWSFLILSVVVAVLPLLLDFLKENKRQKEIEEKFLEFVRALVEGVRSGIALPRAVINLKNDDYGALSPYVKKLATQIEWGIPIREALIIFSRDTKNSVIKRSISIVIQATESGGDMIDVLQSVVESVVAIRRLKEERKSEVYSQMIQGYIVFFIFVGIMLILQVKLLPSMVSVTADIGTGAETEDTGLFGEVSSGLQKEVLDFNSIFRAMILIQGFFAGLMIGKFSEGSIKYGIKHSFILIFIALLIIFVVAPPGVPFGAGK